MNKIIHIFIPIILTFIFLGMFFYLVGTTQQAFAFINNERQSSAGENVIKNSKDTQSTLLVTTLEDEINNDGDCSLREAVEAANTNAPLDACGAGDVLTDTISFDVNGIITVTSQLTVLDGGPLVIDGADAITISGGGTTRVWQVEAGSHLTLAHMAVVDGFVDISNGAGLLNKNGMVTISDSWFSDNHTSDYGGAISNEGEMMIFNSTFGGNDATGTGGGVGGGIDNSSIMSITGCTFSDNSADYSGGGISSTGLLTITESTFSNNQAFIVGGGITSIGSMTITNSIFTENTSLNFGAILVSGNLYIANSMINNNHADDLIGGIGNVGVITITNSTFSGNSSVNSVGAIANIGTAIITMSTISENTADSYGGLYNEGNLTVDNTNFIENSADNCGAIYNNGTLTLTQNTISNNIATISGGAICNDASLVINKSTLSANTASVGGGVSNNGSLVVAGSTFAGNYADTLGGGIDNMFQLSITDTHFSSNTAGTNGSGIYNNNYLVINNSTFSGNHTDGAGGGVFGNIDSTTTVLNSTFKENSAAGDGGGIYSLCEVAIDDSTFSGNSAGNFGGGVYHGQHDPGCIAHAITNSTLSVNQATSGGGIYSYTGDLALINTIVSNNPSGGDCGETIYDGGHNLDSDNTCGLDPANSSLPGTDPLLEPLADNGGLTLTHALLPGSPAIDSGDDVTCLTTDQRGVHRPQDGNGDGLAICDIGAFEKEFQAVSPIDITITGVGEGYVSQAYTFTTSVEPITTTQPLTYTWLVDGQLPITHTSGLTDNTSYTWDTPGIQAITVIASNRFGSVSAGHEIIINDIPINGLFASNDSPTKFGEVTTFTAVITSGTNVYFEWDFGDGLGGSGEVVTHIYPNAGLYTATVTATNSINSSTDSTSANIYTVVHQIFLPMVIKSRGEILTPTRQYSPLGSGKLLDLIAARAIIISRR